MQITLALLFGAVAGGAAHGLLPGRDTRGVAVGPVLGTVVGGATWLGLTWAGWTIDNPLLWVVSFAAPIAVSFIGVAMFAATRRAHDRRERTRLRIG